MTYQIFSAQFTSDLRQACLFVETLFRTLWALTQSDNFEGLMPEETQDEIIANLSIVAYGVGQLAYKVALVTTVTCLFVQRHHHHVVSAAGFVHYHARNFVLAQLGDLAHA